MYEQIIYFFFCFFFFCRILTLMGFDAFWMHFWIVKHPKSYLVTYLFHFSSHLLHNHKYKRKFLIKWQRLAVMLHVLQLHHILKVQKIKKKKLQENITIFICFCHNCKLEKRRVDQKMNPSNF